MDSDERSRHAPWADALSRITGLVAARRVARPIIGISGPVGAGKSTLAARIADALGGVIIATDDYLPDYHTLAEHERDDPAHADLTTLASHLEDLRAGRAANIPVWCFQTHRRTGTRAVEPAACVVCEGIHALHERVRTHLDIAVFVDAVAEQRWSRWARLEEAGERGWGVEKARGYFERVAEPTFARYADSYRALADLIVSNPEEVTGRPR